jgi:signal transduction histidine kinase
MMSNAPEPQPEMRQPSVLIVDDTPKNIQLLANILTRHGFRLAVATHGEQALTAIAQEPPDLVLLDVTMPGMDGFEVCRRIRSDLGYQHIPVVFLTARDSVEDKIQGFEAGGVDYVSKPFEPLEVLARIRTHIELKRARETIQHHSESLEGLLESRTSDLIRAERHAAFGQLVQGIVHNLRGPVAGISGNAELAQMELQQLAGRLESAADLDPKTLLPHFADILDDIHHISIGVDSINGMITSLMQKSRSDHSALFERTDLNKLIQQELDFLSADLRFKHNVTKTVHLCSGLLEIEAVPGDIAQVFQNLVRNALDAMFNQQDARISVSTESTGTWNCLTVSDNGPGIPEAILPYIFDPFFTTKPKSSDGDSDHPIGTGLGLYTCSEIVRNHKGWIEVTSEPGSGTTFCINLPSCSMANNVPAPSVGLP